MWMELIARTGFIEGKVADIDIESGEGPDQYYAFIQQKPATAEKNRRDHQPLKISMTDNPA